MEKGALSERWIGSGASITDSGMLAFRISYLEKDISMSSNVSEEIEKELENLESHLPQLILLQNFLWDTTRQLKPLLQEDIENNDPVKITKQTRRFTARSLTFLHRVDFYGEFPESIASGVTVTVKAINKPVAIIKPEATKVFAYAHIMDFCEWIEISTSSTLKKPAIKNIKMYGADTRLLEEYKDDIHTVINTKLRIEEFKEKTRKDIDDYQIQQREHTKIISGLHETIEE